MSAKHLLRVDEEGIYSHIYNKGIEQRVIFNDEKDHETFLGYLKEYLTAPRDPKSIKKVFEVKGRTFRGTPHQPKNYFNKVELIAYNLMPDHFHLLLHQKTRGSLENFIRSLCTRYSIYFNKKYQRTGALFEGPYKSAQIEDDTRLLLLTRHLHHTENYSSYPEYLGKRETLWVKPKVVQSFFDKVKTDMFKGTHSYKDFAEKYELDQKEKELLDSINFESGVQHLENRGNARNEGAQPNPSLKPRLRTPAFIAISTAMFFLLFALGVRNINISAAENLQLSPTPEVLSETEETLPTEEIESETLLRVKMEDASASANIYQGPTTDSEKIGEARDGDTFEYVYLNSDWYEVRLPYDETTGFISKGFIVRGEMEEAVPPEEKKPEIILTVKMENPSASANIRRSPTINSEKIGEARGGDTFEYVSFDSNWYEVRLADGTTGFISGEFIVKEETDK